MNKKVLVTGAAGFIGFHLAMKLINLDYDVIGIDNINNYYDVNLKYGRLNETGILKENIELNSYTNSSKFSNYKFMKLDLTDNEGMEKLFNDGKFDVVINLAAQPGVRYSLENPRAYSDSNISGFLNILENCRHFKTGHLVFASSSSVYGLNESLPFSVGDNVDHPVSLYAATKKANELMAHSYSHLYNLPTTGLRFFTVYGPWGRPDMAYFLFTKAILDGKSIKVFNNGKMERDFTYIDDIVEGIARIVEKPPVKNNLWSGKSPDPSSSSAPYKLYNIGYNAPVKLLDFISEIEDSLGVSAQKEFLETQPGDMIKTWADASELETDFDYKPKVSIKEGIPKFVQWYKKYYNL